MAQLIQNCSRCRARRTAFEVCALNVIETRHGWQHVYEAFCVCRHCSKSSIFVVKEKSGDSRDVIRAKNFFSTDVSMNDLTEVVGAVTLKDESGVTAPEYLPDDVHRVFLEGARCLAVECHNASATMFRLCVDLVTRARVPAEDRPGLNAKTRRDLGLRLPWLFENNYLPAELRELSTCIKEDGNDGAHRGTLVKEDAEDLLDFTVALLERLYTEPERLRLAGERRAARRAT